MRSRNRVKEVRQIAVSGPLDHVSGRFRPEVVFLRSGPGYDGLQRWLTPAGRSSEHSGCKRKTFPTIWIDENGARLNPSTATLAPAETHRAAAERPFLDDGAIATSATLGCGHARSRTSCMLTRRCASSFILAIHGVDKGE